MDFVELLTDGAAMRPLLQRRLPACRDGGLCIDDCRVTQSRRRISRRTREAGAPYLGVCYALAVRDGQGRAGVRWLYAKAYSRGASIDAYRAPAGSAGEARRGEPPVHLDELDTIVWTLPDDPAIAPLPVFLAPDAVLGHLPTGMLAGGAAAARVERIEVVRHEPEEHCTARFSLRDGDVSVGIYGKCYAGGGWRDAAERVARLYVRGAADAGTFVVGRPLGAAAALRTVWQREVAGVPLADALACDRQEEVLAALAGALARLHAGPPPGPCAAPDEPALATARKWRKKLLLADPALARPLDAIVDRLAERAPSLPPRARPVHGDFHADQMLWCDGRIALFDYDNFALGAPARDVADFVSQLLCRAGEGGDVAGAAADWPKVAARFVAHYRAAAVEAPGDRELDWHLRLMLLRKAYSFFVRSRAGWPGRVRRALAAAQAGLAALPLSATGGAR